jgi:hypothetical protein
MEAATETDLRAASQQGTILAIVVNGTRYGSGGVARGWFWKLPRWVRISVPIFGWMVIVTISVIFWRCAAQSAMFGTVLACIRKVWYRERLSSSFKEHFHIEDTTTEEDYVDEHGRGRKPLSYVYA